ncbi:MAG: GGDEF domain-containing protein [Planctomycetota bacterium]
MAEPDPTEPPVTDFAQSLFSPEEMRGLMRGEIERAKRYGFALSLFLLGIDRLEQLHDLYGVSSKSEILTGIVNQLRKRVRASDLVASLEGDRLLLLSPYVDRVGSKRLAQRILEGARKLRFASDNRDLQVTISIGMAHSADPQPDCLPALFRAADDAQRLARRNGGDRVFEIDLLDAGHQLRGEGVAPGQAPAPDQGQAPEPQLASPDPDAPSPTNPLGGLSPEDMVVVVRDALAQLGFDPERRTDSAPSAPAASAPAPSAPAASAPEAAPDDVTQRRIAKLADAVDGLQRQLEVLASRGGPGVDAGVASLGKVFGALGEGGEEDQKRKELMGALFRANLSLHKRRASTEGES